MLVWSRVSSAQHCVRHREVTAGTTCWSRLSCCCCCCYWRETQLKGGHSTGSCSHDQPAGLGLLRNQHQVAAEIVERQWVAVCLLLLLLLLLWWWLWCLSSADWGCSSLLVPGVVSGEDVLLLIEWCCVIQSATANLEASYFLATHSKRFQLSHSNSQGHNSQVSGESYAATQLTLCVL